MQRRVVIERVRPEVNCGKFAIKRVVGDRVVVEADVFADGHDQIACRIAYWNVAQPEPHLSPMKLTGGDSCAESFRFSRSASVATRSRPGIDRFKTWRGDLLRRIKAGQDLQIELLIGAALIEDAAQQAKGADTDALLGWARPRSTSRLLPVRTVSFLPQSGLPPP
jgi:starch synthase (maltosyl-transferring)